ncbi:hypothetical protein AB205_0023170, partial [Aquarana catesbeiana]
RAHCSVSPADRKECGYPGISSKECHSRGCCFDSSITGVKWCFHKKTYNKVQCSVSPADRTDCGYPGISSEECHSRGCCFDPSIPGVKWCFFPNDY